MLSKNIILRQNNDVYAIKLCFRADEPLISRPLSLFTFLPLFLRMARRNELGSCLVTLATLVRSKQLALFNGFRQILQRTSQYLAWTYKAAPGPVTTRSMYFTNEACADLDLFIGGASEVGERLSLSFISLQWMPCNFCAKIIYLRHH